CPEGSEISVSLHYTQASPRQLYLVSFPHNRQPLVELADRGGREVGEQLGEVMLGIDVVAFGGGGEGTEDRGGVAAPRVADEQAVLAVEHHALHLAFADVVVDGHTTVAGEDVQLGPLIEGVADCLAHR